jgi:hypothetical protein
MQKSSENLSVSQTLQGSGVVVVGLLLVWLLAYAFAAGAWNLAGTPPLESDMATSWQVLQGTSGGDADIARRR